jgi:hypothetical protein
MAISWLSLARQDEAMDNLVASQDTAQPEAFVGPNPTASAFVDAGMVLHPPLEFSALASVRSSSSQWRALASSQLG